MKIARTVVLAAGLAVAVFVCVAALNRTTAVGGAAIPLSAPVGDEAKRPLLAKCHYEAGIDPASLRLGPVVSMADGGSLVVGITPEDMLVICDTDDGLAGTAGPYRLSPATKAFEASEQYTVGERTFVGVGWAAPDVARVEVVLPGGEVVEAQVAGGAYAYTADGPTPGLKVTLRAYNTFGALIGPS